MRSVFRRFRAETSGNVAVILGIVAVPLFAAAGMALDYAFVVRERTDLQNAVDAAAISLAKLPQNTSQADLKVKAEAFIAAYMPNSAANNFRVEVTPSKGRLAIDAKADYPTALARVFDLISPAEHNATMQFGASATASWGNGKVEVVLVLDNTGSMDQGNPKKITMLKDAAKALVDTLAAQAVETDTVKIALVPFSMTVRLPTSFKTAAWMDKDALSPISKEIFNGTTGVKRFSLFEDKLKIKWGGCVESRPYPYDVEDPAPSTTAPSTLIVPYFAPDEPDDTYRSGGKDKPAYDNSYLTDGVSASGTLAQKQGAVPKYGTTPLKTLGSSYGPNVGCNMREIVPLTTDLTATGPIRTGLTNMQATGNTNIPLGLAWGWYAVSPNNMLSTNKPYDDAESAKVIVLLSDGKNEFPDGDTATNSSGVRYDQNKSEYTGAGYLWQNRLGTTSSISSMNSKANERLKELCANINKIKKGAGSDKRAIDVYTVLVEESDSATSTLMANCASETEMYFNVADSADLISVFNNIAGSISKLHLSK